MSKASIALIVNIDFESGNTEIESSFKSTESGATENNLLAKALSVVLAKRIGMLLDDDESDNSVIDEAADLVVEEVQKLKESASPIILQ